MATSNRCRLLLVDDHLESRTFLARLLDEHYDVICADGYDAALAAAQQTPPHVVVTDIGLGNGANGIELMKSIRQHVPIYGIAVTGYPIENPQRMREAGLIKWFLKPIHFDELLSAISAACSAATVQPAHARE